MFFFRPSPYGRFICFINQRIPIQQTIPYTDDSLRSSYMADSNHQGFAAMTHSNRCISLIDTGKMKRVGVIDGLRRTVWTLCFHPFDSNLLATGNLGGTACVFEGTVSWYSTNLYPDFRLKISNQFQKLIRSQSNEINPITSISFHPRQPIICYAILNRIVVWNYDKDVKITELLASEESRIK